MEKDDKIPIQLKRDYLEVALKISKIRSHRKEPPKELLNQAYSVGLLSGVSEEELNAL
jgi:hypothetical protein